MRVCLALLAVIAGCLDEDPITVEDVIPRFEAKTPPTSRIADGTSAIEIEVCRAADDGIAKTVTATLRTSAGSWRDPASDGETDTVPMSSPCETRLLVPPTEAGTIAATATIDSYTRTLPIELRMAPVALVRLARQGSLSSTAESMLTITASLDIAGNGKPSVNTRVTFDVIAVGGAAWFAERQVLVAQGSSVQATLFAAMGVTQLTVTATASPEDQPPTTSEALVITP